MIKIMLQEEFEEYSSQTNETTSIAIVINSFGSSSAFAKETENNKIKEILWLRFNDTEYAGTAYGGMSQMDAKKIIDFVTKDTVKNCDSIIITSDSGKRRAASIAAAISEILYKDNSVYEEYKGNMNRYCYSLLKEIMVDYIEEYKDFLNSDETSNDKIPTYIEFARQIERNILKQDIKTGDTLPKIHELAATSNYSVLSIAKAYEYLERRELIERFDNSDVFIVIYKKGEYKYEFDESKQFETEKLLEKVVRLSKKNHISLEDLIQTIKIMYNQL